MRARMALLSAGIRVELREILLSNKPACMLEASAKGTVPVLQLPDGEVLQESLDIMLWALHQSDPRSWLPRTTEAEAGMLQLIQRNDTDFKFHLDRYKYPDRFRGEEPAFRPLHHGACANEFIATLEGMLQATAFLYGDAATLADVAIFPFVRQFAAIEPGRFDKAPFPQVRRWLLGWAKERVFQQAMTKYPVWQAGDPRVYLD